MRDLDVALLTRVGAADAVASLPKRPELPKRIVLVTDKEPSERTPFALGIPSTSCRSTRTTE